jgi:predicted transcriptional regulator
MKNLDATLYACQLFNKLDTKMSLDKILTFLEIARAKSQGETITIHDIEERFEIPYRVAATRVYYLANGNTKAPVGGHRLVSVNIGTHNHRDRVISLTRKGQSVVEEIDTLFSSEKAA